MISRRGQAGPVGYTARFSADSRSLWSPNGHEVVVVCLETLTRAVVWSDPQFSTIELDRIGDQFVVTALNTAARTFSIVCIDAHSRQEVSRHTHAVRDAFPEHASDLQDFYWRHAVQSGQLLLAVYDTLYHWADGFDALPVRAELGALTDEIAPTTREHVALFSTHAGQVLYDLRERAVQRVLWDGPGPGCWASHPTEPRAVHFDCLDTVTHLDGRTLTLHEMQEDHWSFPHSSTMSFSADGAWLLGIDAWNDDGPAHFGIWDAQTGERVAHLWLEDFDEFGSVLLSPDNRVACILRNEEVLVVSLALPAHDGPRWRTEVPEAFFRLRRQPTPGWETCPLPTRTIQRLIALGVSHRPRPGPRDLPAGTSWYRTDSRTSWSGADPRGDVSQIPPLPWCVCFALGWPERTLYLPDRILRRTLPLRPIDGASEQLDGEYEGERVLLHFIAVDAFDQYYAVDLLERGAEVPVYRVEHDNFEEVERLYGAVRHFLGALSVSPPQER